MHTRHRQKHRMGRWNRIIWGKQQHSIWASLPLWPSWAYRPEQLDSSSSRASWSRRHDLCAAVCLDLTRHACNSSACNKNMACAIVSDGLQIEGAAKVGGRSPSVWDIFQQKPGAIAGGATGNEAIDFYHRCGSSYQSIKRCICCRVHARLLNSS
jgi:hypothetical protein